MSEMRAAVSIDGDRPVPGRLSVEVEQIEVTVPRKTRPDPRWEYVDRSGHFHAWTYDDKLPTLYVRTEHGECDFCHENCDDSSITVYSCVICGEIVEPRTITISSTFHEYAPGRTVWEVTVAERLERGRRVSLTITGGDRLLFGVGVVGETRAEAAVDDGGVRYETTIHGVGPLGRRKLTSEDRSVA